MHNTATAAASVNVRAEMARRGLSQKALGELVGMSQASLSLRLNSHVAFTIDELAAIGRALGVSLETLTEGVAA
jgi:transcriptional regulator with XRE-family HTH domain